MIMVEISYKHYLLVFIFSALCIGVQSQDTSLCSSDSASPHCNADRNEWVNIKEVVSDTGCPNIPSCDQSTLDVIRDILTEDCSFQSSCKVRRSQIGKKCAATIKFECIQGSATTKRTVNTDGVTDGQWQKDLGSWQWAIIWIIIAVVLVALIILIVMLANRCCYKLLNQEQPKFVVSTPTHSNLGSTLNSRSVSMSTLHRAPIKKEVSQEEIDEVRAQFGTARKADKNMKHFGVGINSTLDSRRSSGDGASGEANSKLYYQGDDSSSGIGSTTYDSRLKHGLYDDTDTCHDDFVSYTMKKQAKSPLVNPMGYNSLQNPKRVDENLYKTEAPTVDISEDRREENFRMDINSWTLNKHGQQTPRAEPAGASTITVDVEPTANSDIQLNPGTKEQEVIYSPLHNNTYITEHINPITGEYHRLSSTQSNSRTNSGYIPEYNTLLLSRTKATPSTSYDNAVDNLTYSTLPSRLTKRSPKAENDNLDSGNGELRLDSSKMEPKLLTEMSSCKQPLASHRFYEAFQTPRVDGSSHDCSYTNYALESSSHLNYSYPNMPIPRDVVDSGHQSTHTIDSDHSDQQISPLPENPQFEAKSLASDGPSRKRSTKTGNFLEHPGVVLPSSRR